MIFFSFDVLALPAQATGARQPTVEGRRLWNIMFTAYSGRILVYGSGMKLEECQTWLKRENYKASMVDVIEDSDPLSKFNRVENLRAVYGRLDWLLDVDPEVIAHGVRAGIPSLLVTMPYVVRPEWAIDRKPKEWNALVTEIETQRLAWAERNWGDVS